MKVLTQEKKSSQIFFIAKLSFNSNEKCEIFISFNESEISTLNSYCNTIKTPDGGSHENALKNSLLKSIKLFGQKNQISKILNVSTNDIFDYSDSLISIFINSPSFEGQTKKKNCNAFNSKKIRARNSA